MKGQCAPLFVVNTLQKTLEPGAAILSFFNSSLLSNAKRRTPRLYALLISHCFFIVFPKEMLPGSAPTAKHFSISTRLAASKFDPKDTIFFRTGAAGLALTA